MGRPARFARFVTRPFSWSISSWNSSATRSKFPFSFGPGRSPSADSYVRLRPCRDQVAKTRMVATHRIETSAFQWLAIRGGQLGVNLGFH